MTDLKNSIEILNSRIDSLEERISKLEDRPLEIHQLEGEKERKTARKHERLMAAISQPVSIDA